VHGIIRRSSSFNTGRIDHIFKDFQGKPRLFVHYGDLADSTNIISIVNSIVLMRSTISLRRAT